MTRRSDITVYSDGSTPQPGVYITVKNANGTLATLTADDASPLPNPLISDVNGGFYYNAASGVYTEEYRTSLALAPRRISAITLGGEEDGVTYPDLADDAGAALVGWKQLGTGSSARTAEDKLRDTINAKDFGVTANGTTNDTTAMNNALAAAVGKVLILPPGNIVHSATLDFSGCSVRGAGARVTVFKPSHAGVAIRTGLPVGTGLTDIFNKTYEGFGITATATTTFAFWAMRTQFCDFRDLEVLHPTTVGSGYVSFRISGAVYYTNWRNCFSDTINQAACTVGRGFWAGNGQNETNHFNAATNANTMVNCRACRVGLGMDFDNTSGWKVIGGGVEECSTRGMKLRGDGNSIDGMWFELADLEIATYTQADGSGGFGAATKPARNSVRTAGINFGVFVTSSTDLQLSGYFGDITVDAASYNTHIRGHLNGTLTDNGNDTLVDAYVSGALVNYRKAATSIVSGEQINLSEYLHNFPNSKQLRVHANDHFQFTGNGYGLEIKGTGARLVLPEIADPGVAPADQGCLFIKDNGAGKSQLCVRFSSGATQVIATQP